MKILQTTKALQTQLQNKQNTQHKGNEMNGNDMKKDLMNGIMCRGTSNLHKNINMTQSLPKEEQQRTLRTVGNKGPMETTQTCKPQGMFQLF